MKKIITFVLVPQLLFAALFLGSTAIFGIQEKGLLSYEEVSKGLSYQEKDGPLPLPSLPALFAEIELEIEEEEDESEEKHKKNKSNAGPLSGPLSGLEKPEVLAGSIRQSSVHLIQSGKGLFLKHCSLII